MLFIIFSPFGIPLTLKFSKNVLIDMMDVGDISIRILFTYVEIQSPLIISLRNHTWRFSIFSFYTFMKTPRGEECSSLHQQTNYCCLITISQIVFTFSASTALHLLKIYLYIFIFVIIFQI